MTNHVDPYTYWRDALAGRMPPISANDPQPGRYKLRKGKGGPWQPVAIFFQAGELKAAVGREFVPPHDIWTWCADKPVSEADYKSALETGSWPGEIGHNSGDLSLAEEIEERASQALEWLAKNGITSKVDGDMAANYRASLLDLKKKAETAHKAEKQPHLDAGCAVDATYKPLIDTADAASTTIRNELGKYLAKVEAEERRKADEARKAEEARVRAEMERIAVERAKKLQDDPIAALTEPMPEMPILSAPPPPAKVAAGGQAGRKTGLKTVVSYVVTDHAKALAYFAGSDAVQELVKTLAAKACKAGANVPGVERREERVAT